MEKERLKRLREGNGTAADVEWLEAQPENFQDLVKTIVEDRQQFLQQLNTAYQKIVTANQTIESLKKNQSTDRASSVKDEDLQKFATDSFDGKFKVIRHRLNISDVESFKWGLQSESAHQTDYIRFLNENFSVEGYEYVANTAVYASCMPDAKKRSGKPDGFMDKSTLKRHAAVLEIKKKVTAEFLKYERQVIMYMILEHAHYRHENPESCSIGIGILTDLGDCFYVYQLMDAGDSATSVKPETIIPMGPDDPEFIGNFSELASYLEKSDNLDLKPKKDLELYKSNIGVGKQDEVKGRLEQLQRLLDVGEEYDEHYTDMILSEIWMLKTNNNEMADEFKQWRENDYKIEECDSGNYE